MKQEKRLKNRTLGLGIVDEEFQHIDKVGAVEGITANTNAGALSETLTRKMSIS